MLQKNVDRAMAPKFLQRGRTQIRDVAYKEAVLMGKCVPNDMGPYPDQHREDDQSEPAGWPPPEWRRECHKPRLMALRSQAEQRSLHDCVKDPKHCQTNRQAKKECSFYGMREVPIRTKIQKVVKVRR